MQVRILLLDPNYLAVTVPGIRNQLSGIKGSADGAASDLDLPAASEEVRASAAFMRAGRLGTHAVS